jgi:hypothetical protein
VSGIVSVRIDPKNGDVSEHFRGSVPARFRREHRAPHAIETRRLHPRMTRFSYVLDAVSMGATRVQTRLRTVSRRRHCGLHDTVDPNVFGIGYAQPFRKSMTSPINPALDRVPIATPQICAASS